MRVQFKKTPNAFDAILNLTAKLHAYGLSSKKVYI